ncbi:hypothetical protein OCU04_012555 [Sclerotinia nivalis]|uniref:Uncharacterized protein n=1 Tax=Sclerotinia nivalis TaxID=352851 RepID=A0A9X0ACL3_9HELO|nr:hypothetical protein OCU04_012555 [Sclerotinia nivalis]
MTFEQTPDQKDQTAAKIAANNKTFHQNSLETSPQSLQTSLSNTLTSIKSPKVWTEDNKSSAGSYTFGPSDPNARFWAVLAISRRNRSTRKSRRAIEGNEHANTPSAELEKNLAENEVKNAKLVGSLLLAGTSGKTRLRSEGTNMPESESQKAFFRRKLVTIVGIFELFVASCTKLCEILSAGNRHKGSSQVT